MALLKQRLLELSRPVLVCTAQFTESQLGTCLRCFYGGCSIRPVAGGGTRGNSSPPQNVWKFENSFTINTKRYHESDGTVP